MTYSPAQYSHDTKTVAEFTAVMRQALPYLERLILVARRFCEEGDFAEQKSPCSTCKKKHLGCDKACEHLERLLPKEYGGKMHKEGTIDLDLNYFQDDEFGTSDDYEEECSQKPQNDTIKRAQKIASSDIFEKYEICKHVFTKKQWETVCLYYEEGKTITQIAKELSKAPSTVGNLLHLAKKRKEQYDKKKVKEILELNKKLNTHKAE